MAKADDDYKKLQAEWYKKLKDEGFNDIEDTTREDMPLKAWHSLRFKKKPIMDNGSYYEDAKALLDTYKFKSEVHKYIWSLHSEGLTVRQIEDAMQKQKDHKPLKRQMIHNIVTEIAKAIKKEETCQK